MPDPNMNTAIEWANEIGPIPNLPKSLENPINRAKLVDLIDGPLISNSFLFQLSTTEKDKIVSVVECEKSFETFLATIDDLLSSIQVAQKTLKVI